MSGNPETPIRRLAPLGSAVEGDLTFVAHVRYLSQVHSTAASALIVGHALAQSAAGRGPCIVADDPYLYFARLTQWWRARHEPVLPASVHPSAVIDPAARLGEGVSVGPCAVVEADVQVGDGAVIGAHCVLGRGVRIGSHTRLSPRVTVGHGCSVGERCILHSGVVIGADGFGFAPHQGQWIKIEQLGAVRIGNDVEIGANTCIDRGALDDTVIADGVKLDNLIQIGHNVKIGANTAMAGCVGVAGSAEIGAGCTVGGGAVVLGHLSLADGVHVSAASVVTRSIREPGHYTGMFPIDDNASWEKNAASLKQLNRLRERFKAVEQAMAHAQHKKTES
ncbi:MAG: UDP-3-O-(3-hydroxymyristoyl)glucosamine N-acyltransferase [Gammaproteobacteria bacterium]